MNTHICHSNHSWALDNSIRKRIHNPSKIFNSLIKPGFTIIDIGCGPGTFTLDLAAYIGDRGQIIAADLQDEMLNKLNGKALKYGLSERIKLHKCRTDSINLEAQADFILAFWMAHEVPNQNKFFTEIRELLKPDGTFLLSEPKFHVSKKAFKNSIQEALSCGLEIIEERKIALSRSVLMGK